VRRAEDALAEVALGTGLLDRGVEDVGLQDVLAADVDERLVGPHRVGGDDHPLDERVGVLLHELAVLEGPRLGLVGVADEVLVHGALRDERHLLAHREAGAAAAADRRGVELGDDLLMGHGQRLAHRVVAAAALVAVDRGQRRVVDVAEEQAR